MKLKTKKIIAREFLILTLVLVLGLLCFFSTYIFNLYQTKQADRIYKERLENEKLLESLSYPYDIKTQKQNWFYEEFLKRFGIGNRDKYSRKEILWNILETRAKDDSIKYYWDNKWSKEIVTFNKDIGFNTPGDFKQFIEANTITSDDSEKYNRSQNLLNEINNLSSLKNQTPSKILSSNQQIEFATKSIIILAIFFFGLRYLFLALKWSLKILKQKIE